MKSNKTIVLVFILPFLGLSMAGQEGFDENAFEDKMKEVHFYYDSYQFSWAIEPLEQALEMAPDKPEVNYMLGHCMFYTYGDKRGHAIEHFEKAKEYDINAYYFLGVLYHEQEKFDKALENYDYYLKLQQNKLYGDDVVLNKINQVENAREMIKNPIQARIINIGESINSIYPDHVPLITANEDVLFFTSMREGSVGGEQDAFGYYDEDIYFSIKSKDGEWMPAQNIGEPINSETNDACVAISPDGSKLFFFRTGYELNTGDIYMTQRIDGEWEDPEELNDNINGRNSLETSASLSPNQRTLYFSSDREGGAGQMDLYVSHLLPEGDWGPAQNLGNLVNTPFNEDAPFMHPDGHTLYFSSEGHEGMGGFDIYKTELQEDGSWSKPENLGYPINTVKNDRFLVVSADEVRGYYSSARTEGHGGSDIYMLYMPEAVPENVIIKGKVTDPGGRVLQATITLTNKETGKVEGIFKASPSTGNYILVFEPYVKYELKIEHPGNETKTEEIRIMVPSREEIIRNYQLK